MGRGLSNTHTYYSNQFYLRISYIDKSYKKHPNTELQQTAFIWISYRQRKLPPKGTSELGNELCYRKRKQGGGGKPLCKTHPKLGVPTKSPSSVHITTLTESLTEKNTHHTAFTAELTTEGKKYRYSFHLTHSNN